MGSVKTGYRRGTYEWLVGDVISLERDEVVRSPPFEMGGFKWRLALFRGFHNDNPPEMVRTFLLSCNDSGVHAYVSFMIFYGGRQILADANRRPKTTLPFNCIDKRDVRVDQLVNQSAQSEEGQFMVKVDLKNIRAVTEDELRKLRCNTQTIHLEVIDRKSINEALSRTGSSRIVMPEPKRNSDMCGAGLVRLWAERDLDHRYWLCERAPNGKLVITRCLNCAGLLKRFEHVCNKSGGGFPWVTVFREDKKSNEEFQPIDNAIMVLCFFLDAGHSDLSYLGPQVIQRTVSGSELSKIISKMAGIHEECTYEVFAEESLCPTDIRSEQSSLNECGVRSGCCVTLIKSATDTHSEQESNQHPTSEIQESDQNGDDRGHVSSSSQSSEQQPSGGESDSYEGMAEVRKRHRGKVMAIGPAPATTIYYVIGFFLAFPLYWILSPLLDVFLEWWQNNRDDQLSR